MPFRKIWIDLHVSPSSQSEVLRKFVSPQHTDHCPTQQEDHDELYRRVNVAVLHHERMEKVGTINTLYDDVVHDVDAHAAGVKMLEPLRCIGYRRRSEGEEHAKDQWYAKRS